MTEEEWNACTEPGNMLDFLLGRESQRRRSLLSRLSFRGRTGGDEGPQRSSDRKLRLFGCACCRRIWELLQNPRSQHAVEVSERYADGLAAAQELEAARAAAWERWESMPKPPSNEYYAEMSMGGRPTDTARVWAARAAALVAGDSAAEAAEAAVSAVEQAAIEWAVEWPKASLVADMVGAAARAEPLRDVVGTPFRSLSHAFAWRTPAVVTLAQAVYDERALPEGALDTTRLAALADALEQAGCTDADILGHCRSEGPHVRGCWVVALTLGQP
ncbi:MAG TPA: hypothetical protein VG013_01505 [Gemmataceae bacterium]|jgi:hypothetical protein|nr:hypothetical protein [Gemmataceae bacterium]